MPKYIAKYYVAPNGRESFITRRSWARCTLDSMPLPTHLIIAATADCEFLVLRSPIDQMNSGKKHHMANMRLWKQMVEKHELMWWDYLTPDIMPRSHPSKKRFTASDFGAHHHLRILIEDQG